MSIILETSVVAMKEDENLVRYYWTVKKFCEKCFGLIRTETTGVGHSSREESVSECEEAVKWLVTHPHTICRQCKSKDE